MVKIIKEREREREREREMGYCMSDIYIYMFMFYSISSSYPEWPTTYPGKANPTDIIVIDERKDILPLIIAHTSYTVTEHGKTAEYDYEGFERQLKKQFIDAKPKINVKQVNL